MTRCNIWRVGGRHAKKDHAAASSFRPAPQPEWLLAASTTVFGQAPAVQTSSVKPVVVASNNGNVYKNGGAEVGVQKAFNMITKGADVLDALIAGVNICELDPARQQRRLRRPAECRRHRAARLVLHAWADQTRRRRGRARRRAHAVAGGQGGAGDDRPSPAGRQGRAGLRAQHGLQDRRRPQHREVARGCGWSGSGASIPSTISIRRSAARRCTMAGLSMVRDGLDRSRSLLRHHQLRRRQRQGRGLRRDHHERTVVEDSRAASATRRFSAPACMSTATSAPPAPPAAAKPTSTTSARS